MDNRCSVKSEREGWQSKYCPFMSQGSSFVKCGGLDCMLFVVRHYPTGSVQFAGCSLKWLGKQTGF